MSKFYQPYKDSSKENIERTAAFLSKKPARQGSNQTLTDNKVKQDKVQDKK